MRAIAVCGFLAGLRKFRRPKPLVPLWKMELETPDFQAYRGDAPPRFQNEAELECAKVLDYYRVPWMYEPRTFVLKEGADGKVVEAFTPDFYLPEQDLYPEVNIKLFYKRDVARLAERFKLPIAS